MQNAKVLFHSLHIFYFLSFSTRPTYVVSKTKYKHAFCFSLFPNPIYLRGDGFSQTNTNMHSVFLSFLTRSTHVGMVSLKQTRTYILFFSLSQPDLLTWGWFLSNTHTFCFSLFLNPIYSRGDGFSNKHTYMHSVLFIFYCFKILSSFLTRITHVEMQTQLSSQPLISLLGPPSTEQGVFDDSVFFF